MKCKAWLVTLGNPVVSSGPWSCSCHQHSMQHWHARLLATWWIWWVWWTWCCINCFFDLGEPLAALLILAVLVWSVYTEFLKTSHGIQSCNLCHLRRTWHQYCSWSTLKNLLWVFSLQIMCIQLWLHATFTYFEASFVNRMMLDWKQITLIYGFTLDTCLWFNCSLIINLLMVGQPGDMSPNECTLRSY